MTHQDETQPKAPAGLREAALEDTGTRQVVAPPPPPSGLRVFMTLATIGLALCLCLAIITLSGLAGVRDELKQVGTQAAETQAADLATQYSLGIADLADGNYAMAEIRFAFLATQKPNYLDAAEQLAQVQELLSYTPTPSPTLPAIVQPEATPIGDSTAATQLDPAELFARSQSAMSINSYEEAIAWLDALVLLDPNYRRAEVQEMRLNAHITQGRTYLRGQNEDGADRLARGVQLINRANELGSVPGELLYEADFVARYLAARAYVEGGAFEQARAVLIRLCEEDCDWSYRGVSVRVLLAQADGG